MNINITIRLHKNLESKNSKEELSTTNDRKSRQYVLVDQSELFPRQVGTVHVAGKRPVENVSSHPLPEFPAGDNSKNEEVHTVISNHAIKPPARDILRKTKNIILELIEFNESGSIQIQNFKSNPAKSSHQKTIQYTATTDEPDNVGNEHNPEIIRKIADSSVKNDNTYVPGDILKRSFGNSKFFTGSPKNT